MVVAERTAYRKREQRQMIILKDRRQIRVPWHNSGQLFSENQLRNKKQDQAGTVITMVAV